MVTPPQSSRAVTDAANRLPVSRTRTGPGLPYTQMKYLRPPRREEDACAGDWRARFFDLPVINRGFFLGAATCLTLAVLRLTGPPVTSAVASAVRPYTATGKQETCLNNLQYLARAMAMYAADHDGGYPPMEYSSSPGSRTTWVSLLQRQAGGQESRRHTLCPVGPGVSDRATISTYGLNPAVAATQSTTFSDPAGTLLLADRAQEHDVSLLPPFPGWPMNDNTNPAARASITEAANVDFRHRRVADVVYTDGHVGILELAGSEHERLQQPAIWGGSALFDKAMGRLLQQYPLLQATVEPKDERAVRRLLMAQKQQAWPASQQVLALWRRNHQIDNDAVTSGTDSKDQDKNEALEKWGWRLAGLWDAVGEPALIQEMEQEQSRRSQAQLERVTKQDWQLYESDWGFFVEHPQAWTVTTETDGRYKQTYFRSGSPHIRVGIERGDHVSYKPQSPVDWSSMEQDMKRQYPHSYKRLEMRTILWDGQEAGLWLFETKRANGPRLCRLYVGRRQNWESYVLTATAPAADYWEWQPVFDRFLGSFAFR